MNTATHMLAAAAVYSCFPNQKPIGLTLALGSHFLLDAIPHYELKLPVQSFLFAATSLVLVTLAARRRDPGLLLAGLLGTLPDMLVLFLPQPLVIAVHKWSHSSVRIRDMRMLLPEAAAAVVLAGYLASKRTAAK